MWKMKHSFVNVGISFYASGPKDLIWEKCVQFCCCFLYLVLFSNLINLINATMKSVNNFWEIVITEQQPISQSVKTEYKQVSQPVNDIWEMWRRCVGINSWWDYKKLIRWLPRDTCRLVLKMTMLATNTFEALSWFKLLNVIGWKEVSSVSVWGSFLINENGKYTIKA